MTLTATELREHVGEGPSDEVLERLLNAAYQAIDSRFGPAEEATSELLRPSGSLVHLSRRAFAVTTVIEGTTLLAVTDYVLRPGGKLLMRLRDDVPTYWRAWVDVSYVPFHDDAERNRVALALINLDLGYQPGLTGITIGPWSEQYLQGEKSYMQERETILRSLRSPTVGVW